MPLTKRNTIRVNNHKATDFAPFKISKGDEFIDVKYIVPRDSDLPQVSMEEDIIRDLCGIV